MKNARKMSIVLVVTACLLLTGCDSSKDKYTYEVDDSEREEIETVDSTQKKQDGLEKFGKGCEIYYAGETFEKAGFEITVNSARLTKERGDWINFMDGHEDPESGLLVDDWYYAVINATITVIDDRRLCFSGMSVRNIDLETGEWIGGGELISTSYHSQLPEEIMASADLYIDYPTNGEKLIDCDIVFLTDYYEGMDGKCAVCLYVEDETAAWSRSAGSDKYCIVDLDLEMDL